MTKELNIEYILKLVDEGAKKKLIEYALDCMWLDARMEGELNGINKMTDVAKQVIRRTV